MNGKNIIICVLTIFSFIIFATNIYDIVLSINVLKNIQCELNTFFIGSIIHLSLCILSIGNICIAIANTHENNLFINILSCIILLSTLIWSSLSVGWINNNNNCDNYVLSIAHLTQIILFTNVFSTILIIIIVSLLIYYLLNRDLR